MHASLHRTRRVFHTTRLVLALTALSGTIAHAGDLVVMPFDCHVSGGRPVLTPSPEQIGHRILGPREQRPVRICSPANPDMCRQWIAHRFDVDCSGVRVPWVEVVASAEARTGGRAWVEGGQLHLRMPPAWSMAPDDPCAHHSDGGAGYGGGPGYGPPGWRYGGLRRYCADRLASGPSRAVEMPPGFAPLLGIDAIFVDDGHPGAPATQNPAPPVAWNAMPPAPARKPAAAAKPITAVGSPGTELEFAL